MDPTIPIDDFAPSPDLMPSLLARFAEDRATLDRHYVQPYSARRRARLRQFFAAWSEAVNELPFESLTAEDRADRFLLTNHLEAQERTLAEVEARWTEMLPLVPFAADLLALEDARRQVEFASGEEVAALFASSLLQVKSARECLEKAGGTPPNPCVAYRAGSLIEALAATLETWCAFFSGYDPLFTWWVEKPQAALVTALKDYAEFLKKKIAGAEDPDTIIGDPVGREVLQADLRQALIPYTPEELVEIGKREMEWCHQEFRRAASDMGLGDDWRAAVEKVKQAHEPPGGQPLLVRDLAREAIDYLEAHDLATVPPLARDGWRMEMMSPEAQKVSPFFLGGENIIVSFPTNAMDHEQKLMSMRGNNRAFSRATVQHELIPGHYLQSFYQARYRRYRRLFWTPFWTEGWALHWEMLLWDVGFPRTPEERIGMLFWRMHRCARVVFSLGFHLGQMTPMQCVDMLVEDVRHERDNAMAEVRRSFVGDYPPLYQLAYLIGGLQVRALHGELVKSGRMSNRRFHDAFLRENNMPIAVVRALLTGQEIGRDGLPEWRFA